MAVATMQRAEAPPEYPAIKPGMMSLPKSCELSGRLASSRNA
jgi:hypothetical protein